MRKPNKPLILLAMNEVNFDVVADYVARDPARFPALGAILAGSFISTRAEEKYEELEPWIQWPSVHMGLSYAEHGVFRLGDIVGTDAPQIFEQLEQAGFKVGAISAMNAENRLSDPAYFIPDPWTQTPPDKSWWSKILTQAVSQAVNDNAHARITMKSALQILVSLLYFARPRHYGLYLKLLLQSRNKPWLKAFVLDLLLHDIHWHLLQKKRPDFSTLFLNAGAHIQHHYFFNATPVKEASPLRNPGWYAPDHQDPVADILALYDLILGEYLAQGQHELLVSTGLTQKPYHHIKYYYRLKAHGAFLASLGIDYQHVYPRMTRDFLVVFAHADAAQQAAQKLAALRVMPEGVPLFGEIDNRGDSLFLTLTYPHEITEDTCLEAGDSSFALKPLVSFVAIKNGMHQEKGFAFFTPGLAPHAPANEAHVKSLHKVMCDYFAL